MISMVCDIYQCRLWYIGIMWRLCSLVCTVGLNHAAYCGVGYIANDDDVCLLSVVEMRIEKVTYETTEGDGSLRVCAVLESVNNTDVDCLVNFTVYAYINTTDHTTGMYNIVCSSISIDNTTEDTCILLYSCGFS